MPGYASKRPVHRIELSEFNGSDDWVEIRGRRTSGASSRVQAAGLRLVGLEEDGTPRLDNRFDSAFVRCVLFKEAITAWSLKAEETDAAPMPLTLAVFDDLDEDIAGYLDRTITAYYREHQLTEGELGNLPTPTPQPS